MINGELDNFETKPKVAVLLVGTNNINHTADQVAEGILEIVKEMRSRLSQTKILVLAIPPRGKHINIQREKIIKVNECVERALLIGPHAHSAVRFVASSRWHEFINPQDGTISHADMYDYLHFTNEGYRKFCQPILEEIDQILIKE